MLVPRRSYLLARAVYVLTISACVRSELGGHRHLQTIRLQLPCFSATADISMPDGPSFVFTVPSGGTPRMERSASLRCYCRPRSSLVGTPFVFSNSPRAKYKTLTRKCASLQVSSTGTIFCHAVTPSESPHVGPGSITTVREHFIRIKCCCPASFALNAV